MDMQVKETTGESVIKSDIKKSPVVIKKRYVDIKKSRVVIVKKRAHIKKTLVYDSKGCLAPFSFD